MLPKKLACIGFLALSFYPTAHSAAAEERANDRPPEARQVAPGHERNTNTMTTTQFNQLTKKLGGFVTHQARAGEVKSFLRKLGVTVPPHLTILEAVRESGADYLDLIRRLGFQVVDNSPTHAGIRYPSSHTPHQLPRHRAPEAPVFSFFPPVQGHIEDQTFRQICEAIPPDESGRAPISFVLQDITLAVAEVSARTPLGGISVSSPTEEQLAAILRILGVESEGFHLDTPAAAVSRIPAAAPPFTQPRINGNQFTLAEWIELGTEEVLNENMGHRIETHGGDSLLSSGQGAAGYGGSYMRLFQHFSPLLLFNEFVSLSNVDEPWLQFLDPDIARFLKDIKQKSRSQAVQVLVYPVLWGDQGQPPFSLPVVLSCDDPHNQAPMASREEWAFANNTTLQLLAERLVERIVYPHAMESDLLRRLNPFQAALFRRFFADNTADLLRTRALQAGEDVVDEEIPGIYAVPLVEFARDILDRMGAIQERANFPY